METTGVSLPQSTLTILEAARKRYRGAEDAVLTEETAQIFAEQLAEVVGKSTDQAKVAEIKAALFDTLTAVGKAYDECFDANYPQLARKLVTSEQVDPNYAHLQRKISITRDNVIQDQEYVEVRTDTEGRVYILDSEAKPVPAKLTVQTKEGGATELKLTGDENAELKADTSGRIETEDGSSIRILALPEYNQAHKAASAVVREYLTTVFKTLELNTTPKEYNAILAQASFATVSNIVLEILTGAYDYLESDSSLFSPELRERMLQMWQGAGDYQEAGLNVLELIKTYKGVPDWRSLKVSRL